MTWDIFISFIHMCKVTDTNMHMMYCFHFPSFSLKLLPPLLTSFFPTTFISVFALWHYVGLLAWTWSSALKKIQRYFSTRSSADLIFQKRGQARISWSEEFCPKWKIPSLYIEWKNLNDLIITLYSTKSRRSPQCLSVLVWIYWCGYKEKRTCLIVSHWEISSTLRVIDFFVSVT